jgi:arylsulfatase A-like enzyme
VLVIYLESFRYDLIGLDRDGTPITPFLVKLAKQGARSHQAFVHSPYTVRSRAQLFGGTLTPTAGQRTWIDDFNELGYRTGHFSGQDDSFGESEALLGVARADVFYDARRDTAQRTSRSTSAASLQISWKLLLERVDGFLDPLGEAPVFLYVNIVDTHYPYHHDQLDPLLPGEPVDRSTIRAYNREQVWRTYENSAANVDLASKQVVEAFRRAIGSDEHIILVTADHGQAFYEKGALGHGHELDRDQTQVPLIVWGGGGRWPEPIGAADLRGLLLGALDAAQPTAPRFEVEPGRRVFQYLPNLERPDRIAFRRADGSTIYDFELGRAHTEDGLSLSEDTPEVVELIRTWEMLRVRTEGSAGGDDPPSR